MTMAIRRLAELCKVLAPISRLLDSVGCAAGGAEMDADALGHGHSLLDDKAAIGVHGIPNWYIGYPHPYFGRKILVFLRLQTGLRCKIVKTKEFPAKSSRIRSYGQFRPLPAVFGWQMARKRHPGRCLKEDFWDHCATKKGINLQGTGRPGRRRLHAMRFVDSPVPKS